MPTDDPSTELMSEAPVVVRPRVATYEIRVHGHLGSRWAAWFDGLSLTPQDDGTTVLCGPVVDQSALHGLLSKLRDLGIPLISLAEVAVDDLPASPDPACPPQPSGATS